MLMPRLIACLDVADDRVVKGQKFEGLRDVGDPVEVALRHAACGADEIVVLDIAATPAERDHGRGLVRRIREQLDLPLTLGGGVRSVDDARALLDAGADKIAVNSAAVSRPELLEELAARFGRQCVVLAIDARRRSTSPVSWDVMTRGGRDPSGREAQDWTQEGTRRGAGEILLTSHDRDGTREGYDLDLLQRIAAMTSVPVIASGGAGNAVHLEEAFLAGANAVLLAGILHDGSATPLTLKESLRQLGRKVRP